MDITLANINWLAAIPLGFVALFFGALGLRRGIRFFDHESNASQKERLRDLFLSVFDMVAMVFGVLLAMSPTELWLVMIPIGLGLFIFVIPISMLGGYYQLHVASGFMPKNAGIKIRLGAPKETIDEKMAWYEFTPLAFIFGWLMFFLVKLAILSIGWIIGNSPEPNSLSTIIGMIVGTMTGVIVVLGAFVKSKMG